MEKHVRRYNGKKAIIEKEDFNDIHDLYMVNML